MTSFQKNSFQKQIYPLLPFYKDNLITLKDNISFPISYSLAPYDFNSINEKLIFSDNNNNIDNIDNIDNFNSPETSFPDTITHSINAPALLVLYSVYLQSSTNSPKSKVKKKLKDNLNYYNTFILAKNNNDLNNDFSYFYYLSNMFYKFYPNQLKSFFNMDNEIFNMSPNSNNSPPHGFKNIFFDIFSSNIPMSINDEIIIQWSKFDFNFPPFEFDVPYSIEKEVDSYTNSPYLLSHAFSKQMYSSILDKNTYPCCISSIINNPNNKNKDTIEQTKQQLVTLESFINLLVTSIMLNKSTLLSQNINLKEFVSIDTKSNQASITPENMKIISNIVSDYKEPFEVLPIPVFFDDENEFPFYKI